MAVPQRGIITSPQWASIISIRQADDVDLYKGIQSEAYHGTLCLHVRMVLMWHGLESNLSEICG